MMAMGGTADIGTPYEWDTKPSYEYVLSVQKALVTFVGAEHMIFITPCETDTERMGWEQPVYTFRRGALTRGHRRILLLPLYR
jgi:hypothetical protein